MLVPLGQASLPEADHLRVIIYQIGMDNTGETQNFPQRQPVAAAADKHMESLLTVVGEAGGLGLGAGCKAECGQSQAFMVQGFIDCVELQIALQIDSYVPIAALIDMQRHFCSNL